MTTATKSWTISPRLATGRARSTQPITIATPTATVTVTARTQSGSTNRSSSVTFRRTR